MGSFVLFSRCEDQRFQGYYADTETNCQVFHYCFKTQSTENFVKQRHKRAAKHVNSPVGPLFIMNSTEELQKEFSLTSRRTRSHLDNIASATDRYQLPLQQELPVPDGQFLATNKHSQINFGSSSNSNINSNAKINTFSTDQSSNSHEHAPNHQVRQGSSFLCPVGTIFHQRYFVCVWWYDFDCATAQSLYELNNFAFGNPGDVGASSKQNNVGEVGRSHTSSIVISEPQLIQNFDTIQNTDRTPLQNPKANIGNIISNNNSPTLINAPLQDFIDIKNVAPDVFDDLFSFDQRNFQSHSNGLVTPRNSLHQIESYQNTNTIRQSKQDSLQNAIVNKRSPSLFGSTVISNIQTDLRKGDNSVLGNTDGAKSLNNRDQIIKMLSSYNGLRSPATIYVVNHDSNNPIASSISNNKNNMSNVQFIKVHNTVPVPNPSVSQFKPSIAIPLSIGDKNLNDVYRRNTYGHQYHQPFTTGIRSKTSPLSNKIILNNLSNNEGLFVPVSANSYSVNSQIPLKKEPTRAENSLQNNIPVMLRRQKPVSSYSTLGTIVDQKPEIISGLITNNVNHLQDNRFRNTGKQLFGRNNANQSTQNTTYQNDRGTNFVQPTRRINAGHNNKDHDQNLQEIKVGSFQKVAFGPTVVTNSPAHIHQQNNNFNKNDRPDADIWQNGNVKGDEEILLIDSKFDSLDNNNKDYNNEFFFGKIRTAEDFVITPPPTSLLLPQRRTNYQEFVLSNHQNFVNNGQNNTDGNISTEKTTVQTTKQEQGGRGNESNGKNIDTMNHHKRHIYNNAAEGNNIPKFTSQRKLKNVVVRKRKLYSNETILNDALETTNKIDIETNNALDSHRNLQIAQNTTRSQHYGNRPVLEYTTNKNGPQNPTYYSFSPVPDNVHSTSNINSKTIYDHKNHKAKSNISKDISARISRHMIKFNERTVSRRNRTDIRQQLSGADQINSAWNFQQDQYLGKTNVAGHDSEQYLGTNNVAGHDSHLELTTPGHRKIRHSARINHSNPSNEYSLDLHPLGSRAQISRVTFRSPNVDAEIPLNTRNTVITTPESADHFKPTMFPGMPLHTRNTVINTSEYARHFKPVIFHDDSTQITSRIDNFESNGGQNLHYLFNPGGVITEELHLRPIFVPLPDNSQIINTETKQRHGSGVTPQNYRNRFTFSYGSPTGWRGIHDQESHVPYSTSSTNQKSI